jgi:hypothetical protein
MIRPGWPKFGRVNRSKISVRNCILTLSFSRAVLMVKSTLLKADLVITLRPWLPNAALLAHPAVSGEQKAAVLTRLPNWAEQNALLMRSCGLFASLFGISHFFMLRRSGLLKTSDLS